MTLSNNPTPTNGQDLNYVTGRTLRRILTAKSSAARGRIAARLIKNNVALVDLSPAQVARLVEAYSSDVSVALGRSGTRGPRQRTVDRIVRRYGADALLRALDAYTAPQAVAAR
jgi:hypothetical protein